MSPSDITLTAHLAFNQVSKYSDEIYKSPYQSPGTVNSCVLTKLLKTVHISRLKPVIHIPWRREGLPSHVFALSKHALTIYNFTNEPEQKCACKACTAFWIYSIQDIPVLFANMTNTKSIKSWHSYRNLGLSSFALAKDTQQSHSSPSTRSQCVMCRLLAHRPFSTDNLTLNKCHF